MNVALRTRIVCEWRCRKTLNNVERLYYVLFRDRTVMIELCDVRTVLMYKN